MCSITICRVTCDTVVTAIITHLQDTSNCHSFKLADGFNGSHAQETFTTFTKTLKMEKPVPSLAEEPLDNTSFTIKFMTESESPVEFQASILGEKLDGNFQVSCSIHMTC